ncbi:hypothetical protein [Puia sp.]|jgi:hypothetical protein
MYIAGIIVTAGVFFLIGRNNPHLGAVNDLVSAGKWVIDETGKLIEKIAK